VRLELCAERSVANGQDLHGQNCGVFAPVDTDGRNGDAGGI